MATYDEIHGKRVETFSSDPTLDASYEGQVWFNSTSGTLKTLVATAAWAAGGNLNKARSQLASAGSQTANLAFGGGDNSFEANESEEYNGISWSEGNNLNTGRALIGGLGIQTAAVGFGGRASPNFTTTTAKSEEYDGTSWSEGNDLNTARYAIGGAGILTAGLAFGGSPTATLTEEYNGTSWSEVNDLSTGRRTLTGVGTQTAALAIGGVASPGNTTAVEEFGGTSWTSGGALPVATQSAAGSGTQTAALNYFGSAPGRVVTTLGYDGTSWSTRPNGTTARNALAGSPGGTSKSALASGGETTPDYSNATEEFTQAINTITNAAWASGGNLNEGRFGMGSAQNATQTAALCATGTEGPPWPGIVTSVEEYNGSSWSEVNNNTEGRESGSGSGTQTAGLIFGGSPNSDATEEYDGTNWTNSGNLNTPIYHNGGCGIQTASLNFGGYNPSTSAKSGVTEEYNGSAWTVNPNSLGTPRQTLRGTGIQTAALAIGGNTNPPNASTGATEEYDGSSWTNGGALSTARQDGGAAGVQTNAIYFAGDVAGGSGSVLTEGYDGTSWSSLPNVATTRSQAGSAGSAAAGLFFGGQTKVVATEEFTGASDTINPAKTLTTS